MTKTVIVTGAARGIGQACAVEMAQRGYRVTLVDVLPSDETGSAIRDAGSEAVSVVGDVSDPDTFDRAIGATVDRFGRLDAIIAAAAWSHRGPFPELPLAGARRTVDVTMWGVYHAFQTGARRMIEQGGGGCLLAISSVHFERPLPMSTAYNMAKAGVNHLALTAASELACHRIRVNIIEPGWTDTPGERSFFTEEQLAAGGRQLPFGRLAQPVEIARGAAWLLSDEASYVTGATLRIDGGIVLPPALKTD
jgi:glucose 1-dehydrogenase